MENIISKSLEKRAIDLIIEKGLNPTEALKQAIQEENNLCMEMIEQQSERSVKALDVMCKNVFALSHISK
jgi:DNA-directed RNA polymerase subunit L